VPAGTRRCLAASVISIVMVVVLLGFRPPTIGGLDGTSSKPARSRELVGDGQAPAADETALASLAA
jgi:hypothetical protein